MDDETLINRVIMKYNKDELMEFVLENPTYLTDGYYGDFGQAISKRWKQLKKGSRK